MSLLPRYSPVQGILWMIGTTFFSACGGAQARHLAESFPTVQVVCFAMLGASLWMLPWMVRRGLSRLRMKHPRRYVVRAAGEFTGWALAYHALTLLPLPAFTALTFAQPLMLTTAAIFVFREKSTRHTWIAMATGCAGVAVILRPDFSGYREGAMYVLAAVTCFSICGLIIKTLTRTEAPIAITFHMLWMTGLFAIPFAVPVWVRPTFAQLPWVAMIGLTMIGTQFCVSNAIARAPFTTILPFSFCALIFSSILAYVFFDEVVNIWTVIGGSVILGSAFYSLYFTRRATRREQQAMAQQMMVEP